MLNMILGALLVFMINNMMDNMHFLTMFVFSPFMGNLGKRITGTIVAIISILLFILGGHGKFEPVVEFIIGMCAMFFLEIFLYNDDYTGDVRCHIDGVFDKYMQVPQLIAIGALLVYFLTLVK